jgi:hypothetical protein
MTVILPRMNQNSQGINDQSQEVETLHHFFSYHVYYCKEPDSLIQRWEHGNTNDLIMLQNKMPFWNEGKQAFDNCTSNHFFRFDCLLFE